MITDRLFEMQDTGYRDFQRRLMPDIPKEKFTGVRTPALRKRQRSFRQQRKPPPLYHSFRINTMKRTNFTLF